MKSKEETCFNSFKNQIIINFALKLSEDILAAQNYDTSKIALMRDSIYLGIVAAQGSLFTSGTSLTVNNFLRYLGYSENTAFYAGFTASILISLALDHSPQGVINLAASKLGGYVGKNLVIWAYNKGKEYRSEILNPSFF